MRPSDHPNICSYDAKETLGSDRQSTDKRTEPGNSPTGWLRKLVVASRILRPIHRVGDPQRRCGHALCGEVVNEEACQLIDGGIDVLVRVVEVDVTGPVDPDEVFGLPRLVQCGR
jgi:hypothetical protein